MKTSWHILLETQRQALSCQVWADFASFDIRGRALEREGGTRVIYYFHDELNPIFLFLIYAKADQEDMTPSQSRQLKQLVHNLRGEIARSNDNG